MSMPSVIQLQELFERVSECNTALGRAWFGAVPPAAPAMTADQAQAEFKVMVSSWNNLIFRQIDMITALARTGVKLNLVLQHGYEDMQGRLPQGDPNIVIAANSNEIEKLALQAIRFLNGIDQNTILLCGFGRELDYARQGILYQQITQMTKDINQAGRWRTGSFTDADDEFDFMLFKSKFLGNPAFSAEQILEQAAADRNKITLCAEALIKKAIEIAFFLRGPYAASGVEGEESIKKKIDVILNQASGVSKEELENIEHRVARARQPSMILSPI